MKKRDLKELYSMMFPDYPDIVDVAQLQTMLDISRHHAYRLIRDGYIPGIMIGNAYKVPKVKVIDYVYGSAVEGRQKEASVCRN